MMEDETPKITTEMTEPFELPGVMLTPEFHSQVLETYGIDLYKTPMSKGESMILSNYLVHGASHACMDLVHRLQLRENERKTTGDE